MIRIKIRYKWPPFLAILMYFIYWNAGVLVFICNWRLYDFVWFGFTIRHYNWLFFDEKSYKKFRHDIWEIYEPGLKFIAYYRGYRAPLIRFTKTFDLFDYYMWNHYLHRGWYSLLVAWIISCLIKIYTYTAATFVTFSLLFLKFIIYIINYIVGFFLPTALFSSPLSILLLCLNSIFIFLFKKWLGPVGIFYNSIFILLIFILLNINTLLFNLMTGSFTYIDLGRWFFLNDIIDSHLVFCFDNLTIILSIMVAFLTILAQLFGVEYMAREAFVGRLVYLLNLFATSVILLFCVYDFFLILMAWECIGLFSLLLVNFYSTRIYTVKAALKTFIFSRISDMFIFVTFNLSVLVFNSTDLTIIFCKTPFFIFHTISILNTSINFLTIYTLTLSLAGCIKGAQFFFHVWLPDAMEAPTPASALIHSSTLVIMGIYIIIRFGMVFEFTILTNYFLVIIGSLTIAFGSVVAAFQIDIKKLVAYSTISQMGYLICGCGFCAYDETIIYLIMHACNKAFLFILVGYTVHFFNGNTDLRQMGGFYFYSYEIIIFFLLISLNLIGLPFGTGFYSKEFILFQVMQDNFISYLVRSAWLISFCFTPFYMFTLINAVSFNNKKGLKHIYSNLIKNDENNVRESWIFEKYSLYNTDWQASITTSYLTTLVFFGVFLVLNYSGEYLLLLLLDILPSTQLNLMNNFLNIKVNKSFLLTIEHTTLLQNITVCVIIGLISSLNYILNLANNSILRQFRYSLFANIATILAIISFLFLLN